jgi:hypothetical protein
MNVIGIRTLLVKEVRRFMRVPGQTVLSPIITTTLYFVVFGYSLGARGGRRRVVAVISHRRTAEEVLRNLGRLPPRSPPARAQSPPQLALAV